MQHKLPPKKGPHSAQMATTVHIHRKSAKEELLDNFKKLMDDAEETMTMREFRKAAKKSGKALDRAITRQKRQSETA